MKENTVIILVVAVAALLFWAISTGLLKTGVNVGGGIVAPQPSQNYSGYLAASTAPAVSGALSNAVFGLSSAFTSWLHPSGGSSAPTPAGQQASATSPAGPAQPAGSTYASYDDSLVGPQIDPIMSYGATPGSAFDYSGLAASNAYDPSYSLDNGQPG